MLLVSRIIDLASRAAGPRRQHELALWRLRRWGNCEADWLRLDQLVDRRRQAIDVGANVGLYAGRLAQLASHVHALEPIPWLADDLARKLNPRRVTLHRVAASDQLGEAVLRVPFVGERQEHGYATLEPGFAPEGSTREITLTVPLTPLDTLLPAGRGAPIGFLKIDVEGHEMAVLRGASRILAQDRPVVLVESQAMQRAGAPFDVFALLAAAGYRGAFLHDGVERPVADFSLERHQQLAGDDYVNNFVFRPA